MKYLSLGFNTKNGDRSRHLYYQKLLPRLLESLVLPLSGKLLLPPSLPLLDSLSELLVAGLGVSISSLLLFSRPLDEVLGVSVLPFPLL